MNLISSTDTAYITGALGDLWDTVQGTVTVVKEPIVTVASYSATYVPGFGNTSNEDNFTLTPESGTFNCLTVERRPDGFIDETSNQEPKQIVYLKVKADARNYIQDGRKNLHVIFDNRKYNIISDEEVAALLTATFYIFKVELVR